MIEHDFTLVLSGINKIDAPTLDALLEAGCDDATPIFQADTVFLIFTRFGPDLPSAIESAIGDVERSRIGATVARVDAGSLVPSTPTGH